MQTPHVRETVRCGGKPVGPPQGEGQGQPQAPTTIKADAKRGARLV